MEQCVEAVYENGSLRLLKPLMGLQEHAHVQVTVREEKKEERPPAPEKGEHPGVEQEESTTASAKREEVLKVLEELAEFRRSLPPLPPGTPSVVEMLREDRNR